MKKTKKLLLTDGCKVSPKGTDCIVHWECNCQSPSHICLPQYVEENAQALQKKFFNWLNDLSKRPPMHQLHCVWNDSTNYFWLTSMAEKSSFRSDSVYRLAKVFALEEILLSQGISEIIFRSSDKELETSLKQWCRHRKLKFTKQTKRTSLKVSRNWRRYTPHFLLALAFLIKRITRQGIRLKSLKAISTETSQAFFVYVPNFDERLAKKGVFQSNYVKKLHQQHLANKKTLWVGIYFNNPKLSYQHCRQYFSKLDEGPDTFRMLEDFLDLRTLYRSLKYFWKLTQIFRKQHAAQDLFKTESLGLPLYPFLKWEWRASFLGIKAMENSYTRAVLENVSASIPTQELALFLWENQTWERLLTETWHKSQCTPIFGFQHASVAALDTRFFEHDETYTQDYFRPFLPTKLLVCSPIARNLLEERGFPPQRILPVEAIRFQHLENKIKKPIAQTAAKKKLLVFTDYSLSVSTHQLKLLTAASKRGALKAYSEVILKCHPSCPVESLMDPKQFDVPIVFESAPPATILPTVDVCYCGNSSSTAIESRQFGLPTIVCTPDNGFNLSMLLDTNGVAFASTAEHLAKHLQSPPICEEIEPLFYFDPKLRNWQHALNVRN